jgi:hypothetical protein
MIPARSPAEELAFQELVREYGSTPFDVRLIASRAKKYMVTIPPLPGAVVIPPLPVIIPRLP